MSEIHLNDIILFKVRIVDDVSGLPIDISTATTKNITFRKPDKSRLQKTADFTTDGSDGYIQYTSLVTDLDQLRIWELQGFAAGVGFSNSSSIGSFEVKRNL